MNKVLKYLLFFGIMMAVISCKRDNVLPDLRETYQSKDVKPFGANIAYRVIKNCFPDNYVQQTNIAFEDDILSLPDTASLYFCVTKNFYTKSRDVDAILDFVEKGNTFFLAAADIDTLLLQRIYCNIKDDDVKSYMPPFFRQTTVKLAAGMDTSGTGFSYFYLPFSSSFSGINNIYSRIIGYNNDGEPNCIVFFWGKGKMFLHTDPRVFSNYFLLKNNNHMYLRDLLQLMDQSPQHIYWNDYYYLQSAGNVESNSSGLGAILKSPPLAAAFWISLASLAFFILFGIKRRQRVIKEITPNVNSSVAFTETIARLYLQKHDNKNIAEKMITYFNEYIRSNYFLHVNTGSDDFINTLSRKSGVSLEKTTSLYHTINDTAKAEQVNDYQLLSLNDQIQQFFKTRK